MGTVIVFVKLFGHKPEKRYKWEPLRDDLELGTSAYPMVLVQEMSLETIISLWSRKLGLQQHFPLDITRCYRIHFFFHMICGVRGWRGEKGMGEKGVGKTVGWLKEWVTAVGEKGEWGETVFGVQI
ncbi:hypothetical protein SESBI_04501 [Sesbania bispinosa]|nr:hypothetical protein SESBI_04501 [Sesbania bispinosa]